MNSNNQLDAHLITWADRWNQESRKRRFENRGKEIHRRTIGNTKGHRRRDRHLMGYLFVLPYFNDPLFIINRIVYISTPTFTKRGLENERKEQRRITTKGSLKSLFSITLPRGRKHVNHPNGGNGVRLACHTLMRDVS